MVEHQDESATGSEDPRHLGDGIVGGIDVLEHQAGERGVERAVGERQVSRIGSAVVHASPTAGRFDDLAAGGVDADDLGHTLGAQQPRDLALAGPDVEQAAPVGQQRHRQRQDLLFVFCIGAGGELVLPPLGVLLPQIVVHDGEYRRPRELNVNRLDGKTAIITGGARGQGAAEAELFAAAGAQVVITDVLDEGAETAERLGAGVDFLRHDVTDESRWAEVVDTVVERHGRIDVLVNNAGIFRTVGLEETSLQMWEQMIGINQTGVFLGMRAVTAQMKAQGSGSMINISSIAGLGGAGIAYAYAATKWAVRGMSRSAALELGQFGIRVNSVHPGIIYTAMLDEFGDALPMVEQRIPLGRVAQPDEVGKLVLFLASDDSAYCSGHEFVIDGAMTA